MSDVVEALVDAVVVDLKKACITDVSEEDKSRAGLVRRGKLQDDPTKFRIAITVLSSDPEGGSEMQRTQRRLPLDQDRETPGLMGPFFREIGGGDGFVRRVWVRIDCFFTGSGETRDQAAVLAGKVRKRVEKAILKGTSTIGLKDEFGEYVYEAFVEESDMVPQGGPPNSFIYRGKVNAFYWTYQEA